jgi:hypothetical protein
VGLALVGCASIHMLMRWAKAELAVEWPDAVRIVRLMRKRAQALGDEDLIRRTSKIGD